MNGQTEFEVGDWVRMAWDCDEVHGMRRVVRIITGQGLRVTFEGDFMMDGGTIYHELRHASRAPYDLLMRVAAGLAGEERAEALRQAVRNRLLYGKGG